MNPYQIDDQCAPGEVWIDLLWLTGIVCLIAVSAWAVS